MSTTLEKATEVARALNSTDVTEEDALRAVGLDPDDDVIGEDACLPVGDPDCDVIYFADGVSIARRPRRRREAPTVTRRWSVRSAVDHGTPT